MPYSVFLFSQTWTEITTVLGTSRCCLGTFWKWYAYCYPYAHTISLSNTSSPSLPSHHHTEPPAKPTYFHCYCHGSVIEPQLLTKLGPHILFFSNAVKAANSHWVGQALQSLGIDGERTLVNKLWAKKHMLLYPVCENLLMSTPSQKKQGTVQEDTIRWSQNHHFPWDLIGHLQGPSEKGWATLYSTLDNPDDYSNVSHPNPSICLLLMRRSGAPGVMTLRTSWSSVCVSYRAGICIKMDDTFVGCVAWHLTIKPNHFVYKCP